MMPSSIAVLIVLWIVATGASLAIAFRRQIALAWREPVLVVPVLIVESDDWGYGPLEQAVRLREIAAMLGRYRDRAGRPPVMTLGVILAGPDTRRIAPEQYREYYRMPLAEPVRRAMADGVAQGVFALQLHGMEHFWPASLLAAAAHDTRVRAWLGSSPFPATEELPAPLQSRWVDATRLPSCELPLESIEDAAQEEVKAFARTFGALPAVAVPPTFVWTAPVERAWSRAGVRVVVTPGCRYGSRDAAGKPARADARLHNAEQRPTGVTYLVRDDYFEPALGHEAERALAAIGAKTHAGRPTLLEMHRLNFLGSPDQAARAIAELDRLLAAALSRWSSLRFMSSEELAEHYRTRTDLIERRLLPRVHCFVMRLAGVTRLRKLALASGIALPAALLWLLTRGTRRTVQSAT
jgi:hypothetical protein